LQSRVIPGAGDRTTTFVILWEFDVKRECEELFTSTYSGSGAWAWLFTTHANFRETRLFRDVERDVAGRLRYLTNGKAARITKAFCATTVMLTNIWMPKARDGRLANGS
jgi:hypothetical protein